MTVWIHQNRKYIGQQCLFYALLYARLCFDFEWFTGGNVMKKLSDAKQSPSLKSDSLKNDSLKSDSLKNDSLTSTGNTVGSSNSTLNTRPTLPEFRPSMPGDEITKEEYRTGDIVLKTVVMHLVGPLIGRYGRMDQAIAWTKSSALLWNKAYRSEMPVGRWVLNFEVGREYTWSYRNQEKLDAGEPIDEGSARLTYHARNTLLEFFVRNGDRSYTALEICRRFAKHLSFIPRSEFEPLLNMYVGKQFLVKEGKRFRIRERLTPVSTIDRPEREEKLRRWMEALGPLSQSYLEGHGQLAGLHAKLPLELWQEFQRDLAEFVKAKTIELVAKSNSPEFEGAKEYTGGAFTMSGPYPFTLPSWEELWKEQATEGHVRKKGDVSPSSST